jgi:hypothetical protein
MPFQNRVNLYQAPAIEGDFASDNPRSTVLAGPGGLVAGPGGVVVGKFAWVDPDARTTNSFGASPFGPDGFVHRDQQALIQNYLQEESMMVPKGFGVTLHNTGDFWARNLGPAALVKGSPVYAGYADGGIYSAAPAGASATGSIGSTNTAAIGSTSTGSVVAANPNQITLSALTGVVSVGDAITGNGIPVNTVVTSQVSGTAGAAGVYGLNNEITTAAATVTTFGTVLVVSASTGLIEVGDIVAGGAGFPVGATIVSQNAGGTVGGAGSYVISAPATQYVPSGTVTTYGSTLKVTAVGSGILGIGSPITGTNMPATAISGQLSGATGGVGVYTLFNPATAYVPSETFTTVGGIQTVWTAAPTNSGDGLVGNLVKITTYRQ